MGNLETTYLGLKLKNPLVAASSGLTGSLEKIIELEKAGIAAVVLKSIFEEQINGEVTSMLKRMHIIPDIPKQKIISKATCETIQNESISNLLKQQKRL